MYQQRYVCNACTFLYFKQLTGTNTTIGGLNGLLEDVLALLPQDEIFMLFFEKLDSSPRFGAFVQCIGDPNFHRKYTTLWVNIFTRSFNYYSPLFHLVVICYCRNQRIYIPLALNLKNIKLTSLKSSRLFRVSSSLEHFNLKSK